MRLTPRTPIWVASNPGMTANDAFNNSQKPVITTNTCRKLRRFSPLNNVLIGDSVGAVCSAFFQTSDSSTER